MGTTVLYGTAQIQVAGSDSRGILIKACPKKAIMASSSVAHNPEGSMRMRRSDRQRQCLVRYQTGIALLCSCLHNSSEVPR